MFSLVLTIKPCRVSEKRYFVSLRICFYPTFLFRRFLISACFEDLRGKYSLACLTIVFSRVGKTPSVLGVLLAMLQFLVRKS
jgi:hypothetical protein